MAQRIALFPGSFDPFTNGHLDIITTAARLFDRVDIGVGTNSSKAPLLSVEERCDVIRETVSEIGNVTVSTFDGLVVDHGTEIGASVLIRGLRQAADFEYEQRMAVANRQMREDLPTVFLTPRPVNLLVSSTIVRDVFRFGGDVGIFVPAPVKALLDSKR